MQGLGVGGGRSGEEVTGRTRGARTVQRWTVERWTVSGRPTAPVSAARRCKEQGLRWRAAQGARRNALRAAQRRRLAGLSNVGLSRPAVTSSVFQMNPRPSWSDPLLIPDRLPAWQYSRRSHVNAGVGCGRWPIGSGSDRSHARGSYSPTLDCRTLDCIRPTDGAGERCAQVRGTRAALARSTRDKAECASCSSAQTMDDGRWLGAGGAARNGQMIEWPNIEHGHVTRRYGSVRSFEV